MRASGVRAWVKCAWVGGVCVRVRVDEVCVCVCVGGINAVWLVCTMCVCACVWTGNACVWCACALCVRGDRYACALRCACITCQNEVCHHRFKSRTVYLTFMNVWSDNRETRFTER